MLPDRGQMPFDDRDPHGTRIGLTIKPPVLRRRTVAVAGGLVVAGVVYAALVPFNFQVQETVTWKLPPGAPQAGDALANILVYIPVGALLRLVLRRRRSRKIVECAAALLGALVISYTAEFLQQWLPGRVPTLTDTLCNLGGAAVGCSWPRGHNASFASLTPTCTTHCAQRRWLRPAVYS